MRRTAKPVLGVTAPPPRPTLIGTFALACLISIPVFAILTALEWLWRLLT